MDAGYVASFLDILNGKSWRRIHHQHSHKIDKVILDFGRKVCEKVLIEEVRVVVSHSITVTIGEVITNKH